MDSTVFRTSLGIVFALLPFRKDKAGLRKLMEADPVYGKLDEETARTVSVLMGVKTFMKSQDRYKEEEGYNMCQAISEMMEDSRAEGREEEKKESIRIFIQSNRDDGVKEEVIAAKLQKYYSMTKEKAGEALEKS